MFRSPQSIISTDEYLQLALRIAPGASVRVMPDMSWPVQRIPSVLSAIGEYASIQVLYMKDMDLTIWDAITLIKSLPLLSDLCTQAPMLGILPLDAENEDLHDYVCRTYAPMGERFRCWKVIIAGDIDFKMLATCMLLLALICPNFDYAAVDKDNRERFMEAMRNKINEPKLHQHAPRLRRLLFNGWRG
ncbi:hypothetical protein H4S07_000510 [Coemansia furcata]|uniref:Uncharacterized protein n=1 Tax=Coemansia furcata TaxID=417177 RepID=A0ACC1LQ21_9FUNG|nr:hypothetical protein H4S07_000510 [Coemansia furcata]